MNELIQFTVRLVLAAKRAYARKWGFLASFAFVFGTSILMLGLCDLLPNAPVTPIASADAVATLPTVTVAASVSAVPELPTKIVISKINLTATIENPTTTNTTVLDEGLLKGAVRYPTSAKLGENGNVVLFGHSSYLPIVGNQAYKTFDGIQKLAAGDTVTVYSSDTAYTYRVTSMTKESANDAAIPLAVTGRLLTLSTCNSFGAKTDRFVVVAEFVESHSISI